MGSEVGSLKLAADLATEIELSLVRKEGIPMPLVEQQVESKTPLRWMLDLQQLVVTVPTATSSDSRLNELKET